MSIDLNSFQSRSIYKSDVARPEGHMSPPYTHYHALRYERRHGESNIHVCCISATLLARCRVRERNRVAQKRYRESQKRKMADTEDQVAELTAKLNALATEKVRVGEVAAPPEVMERALEQCSELLNEACANCRDAHMQLAANRGVTGCSTPLRQFRFPC